MYIRFVLQNGPIGQFRQQSGRAPDSEFKVRGFESSPLAKGEGKWQQMFEVEHPTPSLNFA